MYTGFQHLHLTVVILFLLFFLFKTILLLFGKKPLLDKVRRKGKIADIILGTLILITGVGMLALNPVHQAWMVVKIVATLALIPLGIVSMRKENKVLASVALLGFLYIYGVAETHSLTLTKARYNADSHSPQATIAAGKEIYQAECVRCHGLKGQKGFSNAANLATSELNMEERIRIIRNGKGTMPPYKSKLDKSAIKAVAQYIATLRKEGGAND